MYIAVEDRLSVTMNLWTAMYTVLMITSTQNTVQSIASTSLWNRERERGRKYIISV